mgnify:CR=1 FL=1
MKRQSKRISKIRKRTICHYSCYGIDYMIRNFGAFVEIEVSDKVNFGMLITIWLSILENIQRLGVNMPGFLEKYLDEIRNKIEKKK